MLFERLARQGLKPSLVQGLGFRGRDGEHFWVELEGWVLDPTYSQFHTELDWLAVQGLEHPEAFEKTLRNVRVPTDWGSFEHPETYWHRFMSGAWRKSYVYRRRGG